MTGSEMCQDFRDARDEQTHQKQNDVKEASE